MALSPASPDSALPLLEESDGSPNHGHGASASKEPVRNLLGFWLCGLINNFSYVLFLSAAHDIIHGHAGLVLLADILPAL